MSTTHSKAIAQWHKALEAGDLTILDSLLADDAVFHSPIVWSPQKGKMLTSLYLMAAFDIIANDSFHYVQEIIGEKGAMLEFQTQIDGITVEGVDIINWNEEDKITSFKVMIRPLKAVNVVHKRMMEKLMELKGG